MDVAPGVQVPVTEAPMNSESAHGDTKRQTFTNKLVSVRGKKPHL